MAVKLKWGLCFLFVCICGILLHFTYDWSLSNPVIGFFSSKNESTWEHLKLLFFPFFFLTLLQLFFDKHFLTDHLPARTLGMLSGMGFIVVIFYTFWGISGRLVDCINIAIYFLGVLFAFWTENKVSKRNTSLDTLTCFSIWISFILLFILFSVHTPNVGLFYDLSAHPKSLSFNTGILPAHW